MATLQRLGSQEECKKYRIYIECDTCGKDHPMFHCGRCKCKFYCSVECQRTDWTNGHQSTCYSVVNRTQDSDNASCQTVVGTNSACGICWEDPMVTPMILPECHHAFCFACIKNWQSSAPTDLANHLHDPEENTKTCPLCRQGIECVVSDTLLKALDYTYQAKRMSTTESIERSKLFGMALAEVEKILECDQGDLSALVAQAEIYLHLDPHKTIEVSHTVLEMHHARNKLRGEMYQKIDAVEHAMMIGNHALAVQHQQEYEIQYGSAPWSKSLGEGPKCLFRVQIILAKAYEATDCGDQALHLYTEMTLWYRQHPPRDAYDHFEAHSCVMGEARCWLHQGHYDEALERAQCAVRYNRRVPGGHVLVAQVQRAMAQRGQRTTCTRAGTLGTMENALCTMYRAMVYEVPWNVANAQVNRLFLQELLDESTSRCEG